MSRTIDLSRLRAASVDPGLRHPSFLNLASHKLLDPCRYRSVSRMMPRKISSSLISAQPLYLSKKKWELNVLVPKKKRVGTILRPTLYSVVRKRVPTTFYNTIGVRSRDTVHLSTGIPHIRGGDVFRGVRKVTLDLFLHDFRLPRVPNQDL